MVQYAQSAAGQPRPMDTGAVFNGDVRIWLMTNDPITADQCGKKLHELGLPREIRLIHGPRVMGMFALNPHVPPRWDAKWRIHVPQLLTFANCPIILETRDKMNLMRFYKFLHSKNPNTPKPKNPSSLTELADAGEIETIDAG